MFGCCSGSKSKQVNAEDNEKFKPKPRPTTVMPSVSFEPEETKSDTKVEVTVTSPDGPVEVAAIITNGTDSPVVPAVTPVIPAVIKQQQQQSSAPRQMPNKPNIQFGEVVKDIQSENYANLKENYTKHPEVFLADNLLMGTQLFRHFDKDKESYQSAKADTEDHMGDALKESKQRAIVTNVFSHKILDCVGFKSREQKDIIEQLLPVNYFICHEYIEVNRKEDFERLVNGSMEYAALDNPYYRVCAEESGHHGYYKLRCVDSYDKLVTYDTDLMLSGMMDGGLSDEEIDEATGLQPLTPRPAANLNKELLYDRFPTPMMDSEKTRLKLGIKTPGVTFEEEEEEEDDDDPQTGQELLQIIQSRMTSNGASMPSTPTPAKFSPNDRLGRRGVRAVPSAASSGQARSPMPSKKPRAPDIPAPFMSANGAPSSPRPFQNGAMSPGRPRSDAGGSSAGESLYGMEEDNYGYVTKRPRNLTDFMGSNGGFRGSSAHNSLPGRCFKEVEAKPEDDLEETDDPYPSDELEMEKRVYMSSRHFMSHFTMKFHDLARRIGKVNLVGGARVLDPKIMCREEREYESGNYAKESMLDFIPTVEVNFWPDEGIEWYLRKRPKIRDRRTKLVYQWPPKEIVSQAQQIGCNLVPIGFLEPRKDKQKKDDQANFSLQWQVQFTKAEAHMQKHLNHPKLRCLMFIQLLFKTFLDGSNSLSDSHIRYIFYYMLERMPAGWTEEQMGIKVIMFVKEMLGHLKKGKLPHYFLAKRNTLDTMPRNKLRTAHQQFFRFDENILPHLMIAVKRLAASTPGPFYSHPDVDRLYTILTATNTLSMINPALMPQQIHPNTANVFTRSQLDAQRRHSGQSAKSAVSAKNNGTVDAAQQRMRNMRKKIDDDLARKKREEAENCEAKELVDLNMKVAPFDEVRGRLVLEYFIEHFLGLAKKSNEIRADGQTQMFIMHVDNLLRLLSEMKLDGTHSHMEFKAELEQLKQVSRGDELDYWRVSWGLDDAPKLLATSNSFKAAGQMEPLPAVPKPKSSPIPGTENSNSQTVTVELH